MEDGHRNRRPGNDEGRIHHPLRPLSRSPEEQLSEGRPFAPGKHDLGCNQQGKEEGLAAFRWSRSSGKAHEITRLKAMPFLAGRQKVSMDAHSPFTLRQSTRDHAAQSRDRLGSTQM
jgi:hypothetical protein